MLIVLRGIVCSVISNLIANFITDTLRHYIHSLSA